MADVYDRSIVGRTVNSFVLAAGEGAMAIQAKVGQILIFENDYHGDHDEDWIVLRTIGERKELRRFNVRYVSEINWPEND